MARDAIARQYDVDKNSVQLTREPGATGSYQPGTIHFRAKKGKSIDVAKIHESIKATRLSGGTRMQVTYLEITAIGDVAVGDQDRLVLNVFVSDQQFTLLDEPNAKRDDRDKTPLQLLREAVAKGKKPVIVTGRVDGWTGVFPKVLGEPPGEPVPNADRSGARRMKLLVTEFETMKDGR